MKILAVLPDDARRDLGRALTGDQRLIKGGGADAVVSSLRERRHDALVLDPVFFGEGDFDRVLRAASEGGVPIMLYATLSRARAGSCGRSNSPRAWCCGARRSPRSFSGSRAPRAVGTRDIAEPRRVLLRAFPDRPGGLRWVVRAYQASALGGRYWEGERLARRTVDRWMHRGSITGGAAGHGCASRTSRSRSSTGAFDAGRCRALRLRQPRLLTAHARRIAGVAPAGLHQQFTRETFAARLADALLD
jgi:hypothetical protein